MSDTSPAEAEATVETVTFEHFGKTWTVPAKQHYSHMKRLRQEFRIWGDVDLAMVETYLTPEQIGALDKIDPDAEQLDKFTDAIAEAMGFKNSGNS